MTKVTPPFLHELKCLLLSYEGVSVVDAHVSGSRCSLVLSISDPASLVRMAYFSGAANIRSGVYGENLPQAGDDTPATLARLRWQLCLEAADLASFCAFLAWDLGERGQISATEGARLRRLFGAAPRNSLETRR